MRRKLGDLIWGQSTNGNSVGQILAQLKRDIALLRSRPVKVAALEELSPDLGTITAGRFIASSDSDPLTIIDSDTEGNAPTVTGSGVAIDGDGIPVANGGDKGNIVGYNSTTPTLYISATDGKLYAGAGTTIIDNSGLTFDDGAGAIQLGWKSASSPVVNPFADIWAYFTGTTPNRSGSMQSDVYKESGGSGTTQWIVNHRNGASLGYHEFLGQPPYFDFKALDTGQTFIGHYGNYYSSFSQAVTTSAASLVSETIKANSIGAKGRLRYLLDFKDNNTSGANRNHTITYNFGAGSISSTFTVTNVAANPSDTIRVEIVTWNDAATNSQIHIMHLYESANNGSGTLSTTAPIAGWATSTVDTTADVSVSITITSSANNAGQTVKGTAERIGPYYSA